MYTYKTDFVGSPFESNKKKHIEWHSSTLNTWNANGVPDDDLHSPPQHLIQLNELFVEIEVLQFVAPQ